MTSSQNQSFQGVRVGRYLLLALTVLCCSVGCRSGANFEAASLPGEYRVAATTKSKTVNLTRIASSSADNSLVGLGDVVELTILTGFETQRTNPIVVRVAEDGTIRVPLLGQILVAGMMPAEVEHRIAELARQQQIYKDPSVTLTIKKQYANRVTVVGAVEEPGVYELPRASSDLLGALAMAGGRTEEASAEVEVLRKSRLSPKGPRFPGQPLGGDTLASYSSQVPAKNVSMKINLDQIPQGQSANYELGDGDVVMVYPEEKRVLHVMGLVKKPGQFEIPTGEDIFLLDAIALAGGRTLQIADTVRVVRRVEGQSEPLVVDASISRAKKNGAENLRLGPGDLVSVEETPATMMVDALKSFMRFGLSTSIPVF